MKRQRSFQPLALLRAQEYSHQLIFRISRFSRLMIRFSSREM